MLRSVLNCKTIHLSQTLQSVFNDAAIDQLLNIKTGYPNIRAQKQTRHDDAVESQKLPYFTIGKIMDYYAQHPDFSMVDVGSGEGRVINCLATFPFREVLGVECLAVLNRRARINEKQNPFIQTPIEYFEGDILDFDMTRGNVFIMYWPFTSRTLGDFLQRLKQGFIKCPRHIELVWFGPTQSLFERHADWLKPKGNLYTGVIFTSVFPPDSKNQTGSPN